MPPPSSPAPDTADGTLPPDRRQPRHHAAPQPGMARHAGASCNWRSPTARISRSTARCRPRFGDEGAANHMRLCEGHGAPGLEVFVYGRPGGRFPARQHEQASRIVARTHGLDPGRALFIEQNPEAIEAGAFHNDVVAVANERVLFTHEKAFADRQGAYEAIRATLPRAAKWSRCPTARSAWPRRSAPICSTRSCSPCPMASMALVVPEECREQRQRVGLVRDDAGRQRADPPGHPGRRAPVDGQWRRPGLPAAARGGRPGHGRSALPAGRGQGRADRSGDRRALARADRSAPISATTASPTAVVDAREAAARRARPRTNSAESRYAATAVGCAYTSPVVNHTTSRNCVRWHGGCASVR